MQSRSLDPIDYSSQGSKDNKNFYELFSLDGSVKFRNQWTPISSFPDLPNLGPLNILYAPLMPLAALGEGSNLWRRNVRFVRPVGSGTGQVQYRVKIKRQTQWFSLKIH